MNKERIYKVLLKPVVSEKSTLVGDKFNQYVVLVDKMSTKFEIRHAIENIFKVKVSKVNVMHMKPQAKIVRRHKVKISGYKKAYVSLYPGKEIIFSDIGKE